MHHGIYKIPPVSRGGNVPSGEERGETDVFAGYRTDFSRNQLLCPKHWRRFLFLETFDHELGNEIDQVSRMLVSEHANRCFCDS